MTIKQLLDALKRLDLEWKIDATGAIRAYGPEGHPVCPISALRMRVPYDWPEVAKQFKFNERHARDVVLAADHAGLTERIDAVRRVLIRELKVQPDN